MLAPCRREAPVTPALSLIDITKTFRRRGSRERFAAVDGVTIEVPPGKTVALVGESGSGKSTLARIALRLIKLDSGRVVLDGEDITELRGRALREKRVRMQPVFQDPTSALNPRRTVAELLYQAMIDLPTDERMDRAVEILENVGLRPSKGLLGRYPHQLSGGQRQRVVIARALARRPTILLADEPLSGADVSIRGQILNLLVELQESQGLAYLWITHDIILAASLADWIAVMHRGRVVVSGPPMQVMEDPPDDYTRALLAAVPRLPVSSPRPLYA